MDEYIAKISNVGRRLCGIYMKPVISAIRDRGMYNYLNIARKQFISSEPKMYSFHMANLPDYIVPGDIEYLSKILSPFIRYFLSCNACEIRKIRDFVYHHRITSFDDYLIEADDERSKKCLRSKIKLFLRCECEMCKFGYIGSVLHPPHFNGGVIGILVILGALGDFDLAVSVIDKCGYDFQLANIDPKGMAIAKNPKLMQKLVDHYSNNCDSDDDIK